ncbi:dihydrofolate reductase family protein [Gracilibacillus dipsosauri]|uniref:dihydrofolate reductase family protein n=1 Tax=Gracilibacillus dipsosauri TaxID=178340 RepID=UPI002409882A
MRKVILSMVMSLDGYVAGENGDSSWHVMDQEMDEYMENLLDSADTLLYGRRAYEMMIQYWPSAEFDPNNSEESRAFARKINQKKKAVFTRTLNKVEWNAIVVKGNIAFEVRKWKQQPGQDLVLLAGADIAQTFIQEDLIDEFRLILNPVVIGNGVRLFHNRMRKLELIETHTFQCGNVLLVYK